MLISQISGVFVVAMVVTTRCSGEPARDSPLHLPALGSWKGLPKSGPASSQVSSDRVQDWDGEDEQPL